VRDQSRRCIVVTMQSLLNFTPSVPRLYWTGSEGDLVPEKVTRAEVLDDKLGSTYIYEGDEEKVTLTRHEDGTYRQVKSDDGYRGLLFDREG